MKYPKYPAYKGSGVEWIGEIPENWSQVRIKNVVFSIGSGGTPDTANEIFWADSENGIPWVAIGDMSNVAQVEYTEKYITNLALEHKNLKVWPSGTILFSMYASLGHVAELRKPATVNQAILAITPRSNFNKDYLIYCFHFIKPYLTKFASTNTQENLNLEKVRNLPVLFPPSDEQKEISIFLNRISAELDMLVTKQRHIIELLKEKRRAIITHAVTKGLDPNVRMKASGIEWIGEVPEHWNLLSLRRIITIQKGKVPQSIEHENSGLDSSLPYLSMYYLRGGEPTEWIRRTEANLVVAEGETLLLWDGANAGEFMRSKKGILSSTLALIGSNKLEQSFLFYLCKSLEPHLKSLTVGMGIPHVDGDILKSFFVPISTREEQSSISSFLESETSKVESLILRHEKIIELLKEKRQAIITHAVTGKIDVRGLVQEVNGPAGHTP